MLELEGVEAGYDAAQVLYRGQLSVGDGEVVALLGRNGMGKTTTVKTVMGLLRASAGQIRFDGTRLDGLPPYRVAQAGIRAGAGGPGRYSRR